jgi:hypothetical protein
MTNKLPKRYEYNGYGLLIIKAISDGQGRNTTRKLIDIISLDIYFSIFGSSLILSFNSTMDPQHSE